MTTRRSLLVGAALAGAAGVLAACEPGPSGPARRSSGVPDLLLADGTAGLIMVRGTASHLVGPGACAPDAATVYVTIADGESDTVLETLDTASGQARGRVGLPGRWTPRITSPDGGLVALTAPGEGRLPGREQTAIVVADRTGERRRLDLPGNYEPDAFRSDGGGLFVLDWLPAKAPDRYRVRVIDLATGAPGPLFTRDKVPVPPGAEEEMRGEGRQAVFAPGAQTLYTLYTHQPDHQHTRDLLAGGRSTEVHAFVHTLDLQIGWAYCLDLPEPFGHGPAAGHTIAVSADGGRLFVADRTSGRLAVASTEDLTVSRVVPVPTGTGTASSAVSPDGRVLYLGGDSRVHVVDLATLTVEAAWDVRGEVRGLGVSRDGGRVFVGYPGGVGWRHAGSGEELGRLAVPGLTELRRVV
jgi:DNA-binding beta-propeller fold protein YncE